MNPGAFADNIAAFILAARKWAMAHPQVRYKDLKAYDQFDIMNEVEKIMRPALIVVGE